MNRYFFFFIYFILKDFLFIIQQFDFLILYKIWCLLIIIYYLYNNEWLFDENYVNSGHKVYAINKNMQKMLLKILRKLKTNKVCLHCLCNKFCVKKTLLIITKFIFLCTRLHQYVQGINIIHKKIMRKNLYKLFV